MIFPRNSVGIEIAGAELRLAVMRCNWGKLRLGGLHKIAGFEGMGEDERRKAVQALFKTHRLPTAQAFFAVSREHGIVRQMELPADTGQRLSGVVKLQVETLSPWPLEEIYWDFAAETPKKNRKFITVTIAMI